MALQKVSRFWVRRELCIGVTLVWFTLLGAGCAPSPMLKYDLQTPPTALVPIGYAGISDGRSRFREIFCAIQQDHGSRLLNDRPCDQALHRLAGEPDATGKPVYISFSVVGPMIR